MSQTHSLECQNLLRAFSDYIDGELRDELCREIEKHLSGCVNCRVVLDTLKKTVYLVHESADLHSQVPEDVRERLFHKLDLAEFIKQKSNFSSKEASKN